MRVHGYDCAITSSIKILYTAQLQENSRPVNLKVTVLQLSDKKRDCSEGTTARLLELNYRRKAVQGYVAPKYNFVRAVS